MFEQSITGVAITLRTNYSTNRQKMETITEKLNTQIFRQNISELWHQNNVSKLSQKTRLFDDFNTSKNWWIVRD